MKEPYTKEDQFKMSEKYIVYVSWKPMADFANFDAAEAYADTTCIALSGNAGTIERESDGKRWISGGWR